MRRKISLPALLLPFVLFAQSGPVYYWPLDESAGTVAYAAAGNSNGTLAGGAQWSPQGGHHFGAVRFDGVDDRVILGSCDITTGGPGFSMSLWVKPDFVTGMERTLVAKTLGPQAADHVWSIAFVSGTALRFRLKTGGTTTELSTPPSSLFGGTWYHVVAGYDGSQMRIHLNGSLMASTIKTGAIGYHPQAPASLGALSTGTQPFSGWIDDVRVYDRSLSDAEILDLLFGSITTSVSEASPILLANNRLNLNGTTWERLLVMDSAGRTIIEQRSVQGTDVLDLENLTAGLYLVCLQGHDRRWARPLFVP